MTITELRALRLAKLAEARAIVDGANGRDMTDEERGRFDAFAAEGERIGADIGRIEMLDAAIAASRQSAGRVSDPLPHQDPSNTGGGRHSYSVLKTIRHLYLTAKGQAGGAGALDGIELEVHQEMNKRRLALNLSPAQGVNIPYDLSIDPVIARRVFGRSDVESRAFDSTAGASSIYTHPGNMIELLRAQMVMASMGATFLTDMQGLFSLPRQATSATAYMVGEGVAPTTSTPTTDKVDFAPKTAAGWVDLTRRFIEQTSIDAEMLVRNDLVQVVARQVETQGFNGSGSGNNARGLLNISGIGSVAIGTNGGVPTWGTIVDLESAVAAGNADLGNLGYVLDKSVRGVLKKTPKIGSTFPAFIWDGGPTPLNDSKVGTTNLLPANLVKGASSICRPIIYGNWAEAVFVFWSGIDLILDPYSLSTSGGFRVVAIQDFDFGVRHPASFAACQDATLV